MRRAVPRRILRRPSSRPSRFRSRRPIRRSEASSSSHRNGRKPCGVRAVRAQTTLPVRRAEVRAVHHVGDVDDDLTRRTADPVPVESIGRRVFADGTDPPAFSTAPPPVTLNVTGGDGGTPSIFLDRQQRDGRTGNSSHLILDNTAPAITIVEPTATDTRIARC